MSIHRRCIGVLALAAAFALATPAAQAAYPEQPIRLIVGFPPGGGGDLYGRLIAPALSKTLGQSVIVDNRTGAGGNIAADIAGRHHRLTFPDKHPQADIVAFGTFGLLDLTLTNLDALRHAAHSDGVRSIRACTLRCFNETLREIAQRGLIEQSGCR